MDDETTLGPRRYRGMLIFGMIVAILLALSGVGALIWNGGALLGWFMIVAGVAIAVLAVVRLIRS